MTMMDIGIGHVVWLQLIDWIFWIWTVVVMWHGNCLHLKIFGSRNAGVSRRRKDTCSSHELKESRSSQLWLGLISRARLHWALLCLCCSRWALIGTIVRSHCLFFRTVGASAMWWLAIVAEISHKVGVKGWSRPSCFWHSRAFPQEFTIWHKILSVLCKYPNAESVKLFNLCSE